MDCKNATLRLGYADGSGPEYITRNDEAIATVLWGCSCCKAPQMTDVEKLNAEHIVRCVNSHEDLVEALKFYQNPDHFFMMGGKLHEYGESNASLQEFHVFGYRAAKAIKAGV